jgi:hypothetical protein
MKNRYYEYLRRSAREYHRKYPWRLENGLFIPHAYPEEDREKLSWWDDVGFIFSRRRVMVNWIHPRCAYSDAIETQVNAEIPLPDERWGHEVGAKHFRKLGRSRKKVVSVSYEPPLQPWPDYFAAFESRQDELVREGIDLEIRPSMQIVWYDWAMGVNLTAPLEVRSRDAVVQLAATVRRLLKGETNVADEWSGYRYQRSDWLAEADKRQRRGVDSE